MDNRILIPKKDITFSAPAWNPLSATTSGGVSPHTAIIPFLGLSSFYYQDAAKTIPVTSDGHAVGAIVNRGSDSYDFLQASSPARGQIRTNFVNDKHALRLAVNDFLEGHFESGLISQPTTIFAVTKQDTAGSNLRIMFDGYQEPNRQSLYQDAAGNWEFYAGTEVQGGVSDTNWNIWTCLFNGASSQLWQNGISEVSGDVGANGLDGLTLGSNLGNSWVGHIAALIIYAANLSNADKNEVGNWLGTQFSISYSDI